MPILLEGGLNHPRDVHRLHEGWTHDLLTELLTPYRLQSSLRGSPDLSSVVNFFLKLSKSQESKTPVKILVLGGSVVEGTGCERSPIPGGTLSFESLQECAWPYRLEMALNHVLNQFFSGNSTSQTKWLEIHNLAAGGTNSEAALPVLRYWLSPAFVPNGADVIINAYAANDNLPPAFHATLNTTVDAFHLARVWKRNMEFVEAARTSNDCHPDATPPMILYVNDYQGNQQESLLGEGQLDQAIQWLSDMDPSMGYSSIAHVTRRWLLADTTEQFLSAPWTNRKGKPVINVHFGMVGHTITTIGLLYYFLSMLVEYCEYDAPSFSTTLDIAKPKLHPNYLVQIQIPTKEWVQDHQPDILYPNITEKRWQQTLPASTTPLGDCSSPTASESPCAFAFLAAPLGTHQRKESLHDFLKPFILDQESHGWQVQNDFRRGGFQNKLGLVAMEAGATVTLIVDLLGSTPIRYVTAHYLKSYGELWQDSLVEFRAQQWQDQDIISEQTWRLEGHHKQKVSISYVERTRINMAPMDPAAKKNEFRLKISLLEGRTFKINALMMCCR